MVLRALVRQDTFVPQLPRQSREGVLADKVDASRVMFDVVDGVLKVGRHGGFGHVDYCRVDAEAPRCSVSMLEQCQCSQHRMRTVPRRIYAAHLIVYRGIIEQLEQVEIDAFPTRS
jgi:hypothetical protein